MYFGANKASVEVINKDAFGGTYFRNIFSGVNGKGYGKSWKAFDLLKNIDQKYYCSNCYDVSVNKYGVKCGNHLDFGKIKDRFILLIVMVGFSGMLDIG